MGMPDGTSETTLETVNTPQPIFAFGFFVPGSLVHIVRDAPHIVIGAALAMRPADGFPLQGVSGLAIAFGVNGSAGVGLYSWRRAWIGSIRAARFAGKNPDVAVMADSISTVAAIVTPS